MKVRMRRDADVLDHFRAMGDDWQDRLNDALAREVRRLKGQMKRRGAAARTLAPKAP